MQQDMPQLVEKGKPEYVIALVAGRDLEDVFKLYGHVRGDGALAIQYFGDGFYVAYCTARQIPWATCAVLPAFPAGLRRDGAPPMGNIRSSWWATRLRASA